MGKSPRTRVQEIDILRSVAIAAVVVMHVSDAAFVLGKPSGIDRYMLLWVNQATRFAIPLFLFISGFSLAHSYGDMTWDGYGRFLSRRLKAIVPAYVIWSAALMLYFGQKLWTTDALTTLILGKADFQMYFIPLIIQFYLLFPIFVFLSRPGKRWPAAVIFFLLNLLSWAAYGYLGLGGSLRIWIFSWWFFFFMGCVLGQGEHRKTIAAGPSWITAILGAVCLAGATLIFMRTYQKIYDFGIPYGNAVTAMKTSIFIYTSFAIYFLLLLSGSFMRYITGSLRVLLLDFGNASFEIFLVHTLIMRFLISLNVINFASFAGNILVSFLCLLISYVGLNILSLVPYFPSRLNLRKLYAKLAFKEAGA